MSSNYCEKRSESRLQGNNRKIWVATIKLEKQNRNLKVIYTYAPTLEISEKDENMREEFYWSLNNTVNGINKRDMLIKAGDMNAKIGSGHHHYPECIGRYGKGKIIVMESIWMNLLC